uniref:Uncharacterized protein n=1 Tax=Parascaris equorum TaxID=6256 RepID=A0A914RG37_PAREQ
MYLRMNVSAVVAGGATMSSVREDGSQKRISTVVRRTIPIAHLVWSCSEGDAFVSNTSILSTIQSK